MRNHSQRSRKTAGAMGGVADPNRGRSPGGASNTAATPASSSMLSDWYDAKTWSTLIADRNASQQASALQRGTMLSRSSTEATMPTPQSASRTPSELPSQSSVGTRQK